MNLPTRDKSRSPRLPDAQLDCANAETRLIERLALQECLTPDQFQRDYAVGPYRLPLYCPTARLAVEIEVCQTRAADPAQTALERGDATSLRRAARDAFLQSVGIEVLRISEDQTRSGEELEALVIRIARQVERRIRAQRERGQSGRRLNPDIGIDSPAAARAPLASGGG